MFKNTFGKKKVFRVSFLALFLLILLSFSAFADSSGGRDSVSWTVTTESGMNVLSFDSSYPIALTNKLVDYYGVPYPLIFLIAIPALDDVSFI